MLNFRKCDVNDLHQLTKVASETFRHAFGRHNKPHFFNQYMNKSFSSEKILNELEDVRSAFYFGYEHDKLVGYSKLNDPGSQTDHNETETLEIERIYVLPEHQNKGYGLELLNHAIDQAKSKQYQYVWLGVWENNEGAIRFYERHGFVKFGEHPFYMGDDLQTDYLLKLNL